MDFDAELIAAWTGVAIPARSDITSHRCPECDDIADFFEGKSWEDLVDIEALRFHFEALTLFASPAFHYYLPAFMQLFSPAQLRVVARFLRTSLQLEIFDELDEADALADVLDLCADARESQ